jgi:hypothetical protein
MALEASPVPLGSGQQQHASSLPSSPLAPPAQTLILSNPSARLSSSPASSPHIIEPVTRQRSLRPELQLIDHGVSPGVDFFEYDSSERERHVDNDEAD